MVFVPIEMNFAILRTLFTMLCSVFWKVSHIDLSIDICRIVCSWIENLKMNHRQSSNIWRYYWSQNVYRLGIWAWNINDYIDKNAFSTNASLTQFDISEIESDRNSILCLLDGSVLFTEKCPGIKVFSHSVNVCSRCSQSKSCQNRVIISQWLVGNRLQAINVANVLDSDAWAH